MNHLVTSVERTLAQIFDSAFLRVFILGMISTFAALAAAFFLADALKDKVPYLDFDWDWVQWIADLLFGFGLAWLAVLLFVPISTIFVSIFLDDVVDAVEDKYYPGHKAGKRLGLWHLSYLAIRLAFYIILLNILAVPFYIIFFWTGVGPVIIFYLLNGYLLGWGYYEMVAVRHLGIKEAGEHRKSIRGYVLFAGLFVTILFTIPVVNLTAPILAAAIMSHIFHLTMKDRMMAGHEVAGSYSNDWTNQDRDGK
ncbi:EI24 domain-containing protein [Emcibacter sp.]|uniref:EI24 domain-containing protein n=1 Tax=Emcibacter sp. TaxID=1979954 RepID=UPI002AA6B30F|nr:EI24 domain-containing protein [Emcibacter sp.]